LSIYIIYIVTSKFPKLLNDERWRGKKKGFPETGKGNAPACQKITVTKALVGGMIAYDNLSLNIMARNLAKAIQL